MSRWIQERAAFQAARALSATAGAGAILLVVLAAPVLGHGELTLQLSTDRIQPGGSIEVRGDLGTGETFAVRLIADGDGTPRAIATIPAIETGHFQSFVTIPSDVASGDYRLEVAGGLSVVSAPLSVAGSPIGTDEGEQPGQEEGLLVPFPSSFGQVGAGAMAGAGSSASPGLGGSPGVVAGALAATRAGRDPGEGLLVIGLAGLTAGLTAGALLLALRLRVRRTHGAA